MKLLLTYTTIILIALSSCTDDSTNAPINTINTIDLIGQWRCTDIVYEFKTTNGVTDTITYDNELYTFASDSTFTVANAFIAHALTDDHGTFIHDEGLNKVTFIFKSDNPLLEGLLKTQESSWQDLRLENDTLNVNYVSKSTLNGTNNMVSYKRSFVKQ